MKDVDLSGWSWKPFELLEEDKGKRVPTDGGEDVSKVHFEDGRNDLWRVSVGDAEKAEREEGDFLIIG